MKAFELRPQVFKYDEIKEFKEDFNLGEKDLIFTNKRLYDEFLKKLDLNCKFLLKDKYKFNEPNDEIIDVIIDDISSIDFNRVIAIGGGSIVDVAKILILKDVKSTKKLFKKEIPVIKEKKLIIVPTTCGTGSEVTNISIAEIKSENIKMGLATNELYADYAVLIPELCKSMPYKFFVYSSIDALIHAVESYLSPKASSYTEIFSIEAIKMIIKGYKDIIENGEDYRNKIINDFLIASNYAGIAFANAGVGAVHALSYPLGGKYHVPHGEANYQFFIRVLNFYNTGNPKGKIKQLNDILSELLGVSNEHIYEELEKILDKLIKRRPLKEYGMTVEEIKAFPKLVIETQQRLLQNNYIQLNLECMEQIYNYLY